MLSRPRWIPLLAVAALGALSAATAEAQTVTINTTPTRTPIAGPSGNYLHVINTASGGNDQWELGFLANVTNGDYLFEFDVQIVDPISSSAVRQASKFQSLAWQPPTGEWHTVAISLSVADATGTISREFRIVGTDWSGQSSELFLDNFRLSDGLGNPVAGPFTFDNDVVGVAPTSLNSNGSTHLLETFVVVPEPVVTPLLATAGLLLRRRRSA